MERTSSGMMENGLEKESPAYQKKAHSALAGIPKEDTGKKERGKLCLLRPESERSQTQQTAWRLIGALLGRGTSGKEKYSIS